MSKRCRPKSKKSKEQNTVILIDDVFHVICSFIAWYEIETIVTMIRVCQNAFHWLRPTIKNLIETLYLGRFKKISCKNMSAHILLDTIRTQKDRMPHSAKFDRCIRHYLRPENRTRNLQTMMACERILLSVINLMVRRQQYVGDYDTRRRKHEIKYNIINGSVEESSFLQYVFYRDPITKSLTSLHQLKWLKVASEMKMNALAIKILTTETVKRNYSKDDQAVFNIAFRHSTVQEIMTITFNVLKSTFIDPMNASKNDPYRSVVLEVPGCEEVVYVYSEDEFAVAFRDQCMYYQGNARQANIALQLEENHEKHNKKLCEKFNTMHKNYIPPSSDYVDSSSYSSTTTSNDSDSDDDSDSDSDDDSE